MEKLISVLLCLLLSTISLAGCLDDSDTGTSEESDNSGNSEATNLFEGDDAGECNDGADNDRDGLFDCDDPDCAGSPVCKANEENNSTQNGNYSSDDDYYSQLFDDQKIVNVTNGIISSGYLDRADCNILLFVKDWDSRSYVMKQKLLEANLGDSLNYRIWIAAYEDVGYSIGLPRLYDWRNGAINTDDGIGVYVFDDDEVLFLGYDFIRGTDLGTICLPSQRDSLSGFLEILDPPPPPPIPFTWSLPLVTVDEITKWEEDYQKGESVCEIIAFNQNADGMWYGLEDWHDAIVTASNAKMESSVGVWMINMTLDNGRSVEYQNLLDNLGISDIYDSSLMTQFIILDNSNPGWNIVSNLDYSDIGQACSTSYLTDEVYHFFHSIGAHPFDYFNGDFETLYTDWMLTTSYDNPTEYDEIEKENFQLNNSVHIDSILNCSGSSYEYYVLNKSWSINNQTIPGDVLDLNDHDVSVGDEIVCSIRVEDIFSGEHFYDEIRKNVTARAPLISKINIVQDDKSIYCNYTILNPENIPISAVIYWVTDSNDDDYLRILEDWTSTYSFNSSLNTAEKDPTSSGDIDLSVGNLIACAVEIYSQEDAQLMVDYGWDGLVYDRRYSSSSAEAIIN